ncbi:hypothetical protein FZEAL_3737 [Fusarium zealandicum]|uniref:PD-(D/E)XK nuclease-like domain-containing protein n=1 Tax=Fusarium zealandicum TaxID=1053134 RepID=A0A8H4UN33_9HYPO|nr:hypothetical protein FZEAL_3737 [Fusarium zealandicum]
MLDHDSITRWLSAIDDTIHPDSPEPKSENKHKRKHPAADSQRRKRTLPSPPISMSSQEGSPSKRQRLCPDPDKTPTRYSTSSFVLSQDARSEQASTKSSASQRSGTSSPTKNIADLRNEKLVAFHNFAGLVAVPPPLHAVVRDIRKLATGRGVLTSEDAEALRNTDNDIGDFRDDLSPPSLFIDTSGTRSNLGQLPPINRLVDEIWDEAIYCERHALPEAAWNSSVHFPLLQTALCYASVNDRAKQQQQQFKIKPTNVSTINVEKRYIPRTQRFRHNKRIDFCLYLDVADDSPLEDSIASKVRTRPHDSINHTEAPWLSRMPICVGIETKKTGEDWHAALEQIAIWTTAHWKRLRELTANTESLPFLPAVIVQGHDWSFVAATEGKVLEGGERQTVVWSKIPIGSTEGVEGICKIIAVLQYLASWSAETYWPWFRQAVLEQTPAPVEHSG